MTTQEIIGGVITFVTGGGLMHIFNARQSSKKLSLETHVDLITRLDSDYKELKKEYNSLRDELEVIRLENSTLKFELMMLRSDQVNFPFPVWYVDVDGVMRWMNDPYKKLYGKDELDIETYIGKKHTYYWGKELGAVFRKHDLKVMKSGRLWVGFEGVPLNTGFNVSVKWPHHIGTNNLGVWGMTIPVHEVNLEELKRYFNIDQE